MEQTDYEYKGLYATYWDLLRGDTSKWEDRFFFLDLIGETGQPVLDVGCGTGRLLLDYIEQGIDIDGMDNSPEMLDICRRKAEKRGMRPNLFLQTMETLDLPRKYRTIIVPSHSFQLLTDLEEAAEAMRRFHLHLELGGTLVTPLLARGRRPRIYWTGGNDLPIEAKDWDLMVEKEDPQMGVQVRRWIRYRFDLSAQLEHTEDKYELVRDGVVIASEYFSRSPAFRWYTQEHAVSLYLRAGFTNIQVLKGTSREPAASTDTFFSLLGTK